jgi:hypothetical protein
MKLCGTQEYKNNRKRGLLAVLAEKYRASVTDVTATIKTL